MFGQIKWTALLLAAGILASVSFGSGVWIRGAFCDSAAVKVQLQLAQNQIDGLNRNITARDSAEKAIRAQSELDREELARLQNEIEDFKATDGVCFPDSDVNGLRRLWGK